LRRSILVAVAALATVLTLSGCMWQTASGTSFGGSLSGTVTGWPITGTYQATVTVTGPFDSFQCAPVTVSVLLTDAAGNTLQKQETGRLCQIEGDLFSFSGQYTITGGTGLYEGATGRGIATMEAVFGPRASGFSAQEIGTFQVPGTSSATSGRKTFKMRGTVKFATSKGNQ
jgi:hypothetical protein